MDLTSLAMLGALAGVTWLVLFRRPGRVRAASPAQATRHAAVRTVAAPGPAAPRPQPFHAVSIETDAVPCTAVRQLGDQRFLSSEAPPLPLPGCDRGRCECRYRHHEDRRSHEERRMPFTAFGGFGVQEVEGERRRRRDRRKRRRLQH